MKTRSRSSKATAPLVAPSSVKSKAPLPTRSSKAKKAPLTTSSSKSKAPLATSSSKSNASLATSSSKSKAPLKISSSIAQTPVVTPSEKTKPPLTNPLPNKLETPQLVSLLTQNHCLFCLGKKIGTVFTINSSSRYETDGYELLRRYFGVNTAESLCHIFDAAAFSNKVLLSAEFPAPLLCQKCVDKLRELDEMHYKLEMVQQAILLNIRSTRKMIVNSFGSRKEASTSTSNQKGQDMSEMRQKFEMDILSRCDNDSGNKGAVLKILDDFYQTLLEETQDSICFPLEHLNQVFTCSQSPSIASDDDADIIDVEDSYEAPVSPASCLSDNDHNSIHTNSNQSESEEDTQASSKNYTILIKRADTDTEDEEQASSNTVKEGEGGQKLSKNDTRVTTEIRNTDCDSPTTAKAITKTVQSPSKSSPKVVEATPATPSPSQLIPQQIHQKNPLPALISPINKNKPPPVLSPSFHKPASVNDSLNAGKGVKTVDVVIQRSASSINISVQKDDQQIKPSDIKPAAPGKNNADSICKSPVQNRNLKRKLSESDGNNTRGSPGASPAKSVTLSSPVKPTVSNNHRNRSPPKAVEVASSSGCSPALGSSQRNKDGTASDQSAPVPPARGGINHSKVANEEVSPSKSEATSTSSASAEQGEDENGSSSDSGSDSESGSGSGSSSSDSDSEDSSSEDSSSEEEQLKKNRLLKPREKGFIGPRLPPNYMRERLNGLPKPYKCTECDYECCNLTRFKPHLRKVHGIEYQIKINRRTYVCDICGYSRDGERIGYFIFHLETHETDVKSRSCSDCSQKFTTKQLYQMHQCSREGLTQDEQTPTEEEKRDDLVCRFCTLLCRGVNYYINHIKKEHPGNDPYLCPICLRGFKQKDNMISHKITEHNAVKLKCRICEPALEFKSCRERFKHVNMKHHNFSLKCSYCPKMFLGKGSLKAHEVTHTKEKNFVCSECGNAYTTSSTLKKHMESMHSGGEPERFVCEHCSRTYSARENLVKHIKSKHRKT